MSTLLSVVLRRRIKGDARAYLRAAHHWLRIYFEQREKNKDKDHFGRDALSDDDLAEFAWATLNLSGPQIAFVSLLAGVPRRLHFG